MRLMLLLLPALCHAAGPIRSPQRRSRSDRGIQFDVGVESADTAPFFHNHAVAALEESVAFDGTAADPEVLRISAFLRVLNVLENIRSSVSTSERGRRAASLDEAKELATLAREEVLNALEVSGQGLMAANPDLSASILRVRLIGDRAGAGRALAHAADLLRNARAVLVAETTLPDSFRH